MTTAHSRATVPYSADAMFALVADIEKYPEFIPYCIGLRVNSSSVADGVGEMTADMLVAYKVFREQFNSLVTLNQPAGRIDVRYLRGPFHHLNTMWRFEEGSGGSSDIIFDIDFEFKNIILQKTAKTVFDKAFAKMSDAFVQRAHQVYG